MKQLMRLIGFTLLSFSFGWLQYGIKEAFGIALAIFGIGLVIDSMVK